MSEKFIEPVTIPPEITSALQLKSVLENICIDSTVLSEAIHLSEEAARYAAKKYAESTSNALNNTSHASNQNIRFTSPGVFKSSIRIDESASNNDFEGVLIGRESGKARELEPFTDVTGTIGSVSVGTEGDEESGYKNVAFLNIILPGHIKIPIYMHLSGIVEATHIFIPERALVQLNTNTLFSLKTLEMYELRMNEKQFIDEHYTPAIKESHFGNLLDKLAIEMRSENKSEFVYIKDIDIMTALAREAVTQVQDGSIDRDVAAGLIANTIGKVKTVGIRYKEKLDDNVVELGAQGTVLDVVFQSKNNKNSVNIILEDAAPEVKPNSTPAAPDIHYIPLDGVTSFQF